MRRTLLLFRTLWLELYDSSDLMGLAIMDAANCGYLGL
jgi:hypothetical protein